MSDVLPLFPLRLVLFPGRPLPLHIFEPRYRALLSDVLAADRRFGILAIREGTEVGGEPAVFEVGTVAEVEEVEQYEDGRADVTTRGVERFRVVELLHDRPYLRAKVQPCTEERPENVVAGNGQLDADTAALRALLGPYLADLGAPPELLAHLPHDPAELSWLTAAALHVDVAEQQRLLELDALGARIAAAQKLLRREWGIMRHVGANASFNPPGPGGAELN